MIQKISLANLPTRIDKLERLSEDWGINLFIKNVTSNITFTLSNISAGNDIVHTFILEIRVFRK